MKLQLFCGGTAEVNREVIGPPDVVRVQLILTDFEYEKIGARVVLTYQEVEALAHALRYEQSLLDASPPDGESWRARG